MLLTVISFHKLKRTRVSYSIRILIINNSKNYLGGNKELYYNFIMIIRESDVCKVSVESVSKVSPYRVLTVYPEVLTIVR